MVKVYAEVDTMKIEDMDLDEQIRSCKHAIARIDFELPSMSASRKKLFKRARIQLVEQLNYWEDRKKATGK